MLCLLFVVGSSDFSDIDMASAPDVFSVPGIEDWGDKSPTLSFLLLENRTTAAVIALPSATDYSKSLTFSKYDLTNYGDAHKEPDFAYNLSSLVEEGLLSDETDRTMTAEQSAAEWLKKDVIGQFSREEKKRLMVKSKQALTLPEPSPPPLETNSLKLPDVGVYWHERGGDENVVFQVEVDSGDYRWTCIKLVDGISQQLIWERNRDDSVTSWTGMYMPTFGRGNGCVLITVSWNDSLFEFRVKKMVPEYGDLVTEIQQAIATEIQKIKQIASLECQATQLILPMTRSFVTDTFGRGALQVGSGESVVIINRLEACVFKRPLHKDIIGNLLSFKQEASQSTVTQFLLPTGTTYKHEVQYLQYKLLKPPLSDEKAESILPDLITSVVHALTELHDYGRAHLDVRLENICFNSHNQAVLIDLDRSRPVNMRVRAVLQESVMYPFHDEWVYKQWDFVQLAVLIGRVIDRPQSTEEYHSVKPPLNHAFLNKLYDEGVIDEVLFDTWKESWGRSSD